MMKRPAQSTVRQWAYVIIGLASSLGFMWVAVARLELRDVWAALHRAALFPWLPLAVFMYLCGQLVRGVRCRKLVSHEARLSTLTATNVVVLGYAVNNIAPARLGELARAGMLAQRSGLPFVQSLSVTLLERVLDGLVMLGLLAVTHALMPVGGWVAATLELGAVIFGIALAGTLVAVMAPAFLLGTMGRVANVLGARVHDRVLYFVSQVVQGVKYLRRPMAALNIALLSLAVWLLEACMFLCLQPAFGLEVNLLVALLAMTITNLGILLPSSPGFIGPFHFFCMKALMAVGVTEAVSFSYAVLVHLTFYIPVTAWGVAIIFGYGVRLGTRMERQRYARLLDLEDIAALSIAAPALGAARPGALYTALVEALVPLPRDDSEQTRATLLADVARFVREQTNALPARLQLLLAVGLFGFRIATRVRFLRGYCALPLGRRRRWTEQWAYGRVGLARQLFRPLRATAAVAYYEHPLVRGMLEVERARRGAGKNVCGRDDD